jgi:6-methylsalicylate decarboxylase
VLNGVTDRYPAVRIILAHAGGFLPYASHRFAELARIFRPEAESAGNILANFQRFYFDTALSSGPAALPTLKAFAGSGRILFGSDFPYVSAHIAGTFTAKLDNYKGLTIDESAAISHANAWTMFPRLAPQFGNAAQRRVAHMQSANN